MANTTGEIRSTVREYLLEHPQVGTKEAASELGCSRRTVRRAKAEIGRGFEQEKMPRILIFDIETSPMEAFIWRPGKQYIGPDNIIKDWAILSWSAKWFYESEIMSAVVTPREAKARTDRSVIKSLWNLINEADVVIAHNAARFDLPKSNSRFLLNGLPKPMPYKTIDTLQVVKSNFAFSSNKLDYLNLIMNRRQKIETNYSLWKRCVAGELDALKEMERYNRGDVVALEELYIELRHWVRPHPNMGLYCEGSGQMCPNCGSENLKWEGKYYTPAGRFKAFRCECGAVGRSRASDLTKEQRRTLTISV